MELTNELVPRELADDEPKDDGNAKTDGEAQKEPLVLAVNTKHLDGTNGSPQDGGSKEGVDAGAEETHGRVGLANVLNVDLEVEHTSADESGNERGHHLGGEGVTGRDLDVVSELEIVGEADGMRAGHISVEGQLET